MEFDFVDAPYEGGPAPGIDQYFKPPFLVWHNDFVPSQVSRVHDYIRAVVAQDGPYDGVIGFSEGAALAAAILIEDTSSVDGWCIPTFRFAMFFNAVNLLSPTKAFGKRLLESDVKKAMDTFTEGANKHQYPALDCVYTLCAKSVPALINVPTLHVLGLRDNFREASEELIKLCEGHRATTVRTTAGHEMPRGQEMKQVAEKLDEMIGADYSAT